MSSAMETSLTLQVSDWSPAKSILNQKTPETKHLFDNLPVLTINELDERLFDVEPKLAFSHFFNKHKCSNLC